MGSSQLRPGGEVKVLIFGEFSGIVRDAFAARGHDATSCDLLPSERPGKHIQGDGIPLLYESWDLLIAHPYCTDTAVSGARWFKEKIADGRQQRAIEHFMTLVEAPIEKKCLEHPISIMSRIYRKPDQIIQPYWFGDSCQKATCLWLFNLPQLIPTNIVDRGMIYVDPRGMKHGGVHVMRAKVGYSPLILLPRNEERWKIRSRTFQGVATAMAAQWGAAK